MLTRIFSAVVVMALVFTACNSGTDKTGDKAADTTMAAKPDSATNAFEHMLVDNQKDPACGMPVSAGISDTAVYKGKVLGFCSKECKETFKKEPEKLIASAELKK